ncbi:MAG: 2-oxoacid:acceptor oxidoreductase family protein [Alistipes sp.]|nr:2-oxoacid:acceptor oxidoreductase family protein [Alistipes sp.]
MKETVIIAGFGGQGVLSMGKILAYAGVVQGMEVSWMPAYGPEMRGGTANVTVILADRRIPSPIATEFDSAVILNQQSMDKFEEAVRPGGVLVYDTNGISRHPSRRDISIYAMEATGEAARRGMTRMFNTMVLGGYLAARPVVTADSVMESLRHSLPERARAMIPANGEAMRAGGAMVRRVE